ncbi:hypothetical protein KW796_00815 [Candidatus Parcubacteria bacterium]|nr:hypothetical protein [Candidatus Parcubacteria bacterium]
MQITNIIYPIEGGLVSLTRYGEIWGGWRGEFNVGNGELRLVAIVNQHEHGQSRRYHVYFFLPPEDQVLNPEAEGLALKYLNIEYQTTKPARLKFLHKLNAPTIGSPVQHFDFWELPTIMNLMEFDSKYLPRIIACGLELRDSPEALDPMVFIESESQAA